MESGLNALETHGTFETVDVDRILTVHSKQNEVYLMSKVATICLFLYLNKCIQFN